VRVEGVQRNGLVRISRNPHAFQYEVIDRSAGNVWQLWGPWFCAKYGAPKLRDGGSIVFCSGVLCRSLDAHARVHTHRTHTRHTCTLHCDFAL